jgi:hypothetical protein
LSIEESVAANKEGFIQLGDDQMVFLIYTKNNRHDRHRDVEGANTLSWHAHTFYFKAAGDRANITIGSMDKTTGLFIDDLHSHDLL